MPKKILIIEDEEYLAELYKMKFEHAGYGVFAADEGAEGLQIAEKEQPDLILLDIMLPNMDGYEILERLKKNPKTKAINVFFLSNMVQDGEIKKGMQAGADDYLIKSNLTPSQLLEKVENFFKMENGIKEVKEPLPVRKKTVAKKGTAKNNKDGYKVLLVEDNEALIEMYFEVFKESGIMVEVARNGAWGLKLAFEKQFDLIVLDMVMPAMDGYETIRRLKDKKATKNLPIIVLSNSAQDSDIDKAKAAGVSSYLLKSKVTPSQLISEVKKYIK